MSPEIIVLLSAASFLTSAFTSVAGAGGGTVLLALMLNVVPPTAAIPTHGVIQLASNASRAWLLRRHMAWPVIVRFAALMPLGVLIGLWIVKLLPPDLIKVLIGGFVILTLFSGVMRTLASWRMPLWAFVPVGFVTGILNMVVGVIGPVLGALMARTDLDRHAIVGTLGFFGVLGNLLKIAGFTFVGFSLIDYAPLLAGMVPAALLGPVLGKRLLGYFDEATFRRILTAVLVVLALKLIVWDGGSWLVELLTV